VPAAHGAFLTVEEGPQRDDLDRFGGFSIVAERGSERWSGRQAALLFDESALVEIGILSPGRVAASGLRQQHYRREYELAGPIPSEAIHAKLAPRLRGHFRDALAAEGRVPARRALADRQTCASCAGVRGRFLLACSCRVEPGAPSPAHQILQTKPVTLYRNAAI
jgi:hypothetical protein